MIDRWTFLAGFAGGFCGLLAYELLWIGVARLLDWWRDRQYRKRYGY